jgi:hypothetical protein
MGIPIDAHAAPVTWTLDNVVFDDGATATGSFVYDRDTNTYSTISITTNPPHDGCNADYTVERVPNNASQLILYDRALSGDMSDACSLALWFEVPYPTNDGGEVGLRWDDGPLSYSREHACSDAACGGVSYLRDVISGSVIGTVTDTVDLCITGRWTADDFTVASPPTADDPAFDGKVFGVAPSSGSTSIHLKVDTTGYLFFQDPYGQGHDLYGYSGVTLGSPPHTFGTATWENILPGMQGPDGAEAALWTDTDLTSAAPTLITLRMMGEAPELRELCEADRPCSADIFFEGRFRPPKFLLWEFYAGEEIRNQTYTAVLGACGPDDTDGDGIPDDQDICPLEDATGFDANQDGCIDTLGGLSEVIDTLLEEAVIDEAMATPLQKKVTNAATSASKENVCAGVNQLEAFQNQIEAQTGKKVSAEAAAELIAYAENVIEWLLGALPAGESC